jgi:multiple sugar transport system permease protein
VALATAWEVLLHPGFGLANLLLSALGQPKLRFLADPDLAIFTLAGIGIWQLAGFNMVLFLSGLASIPRELYDAAAVDGAARGLDRFRLVTWPMLGPTTMFVVVVTAIRGLQVFDTVAVLTRGGPDKATEVLLYAIYVEGFRYFRIGYASALTVVFLALAAALTLAQTRLMDRKVHYQ